MGKLAVPVIGQRDSRWKDKKLGTSNTTIGDYGCVITSMAMLCQYYGKTTDPILLNKETIKVNGFVGGNLYVWQSISKIYPDIKNTAISNYPTTPAPIERIDSQLENGKPVVAWLDLNANQPGADHFSLIVGKEGNDYWLNDTWYGDQILFSKRYGDPIKYIFGHRFYTGPVPEVVFPSPDPLAECKKQVQEEIEKKNENWRWGMDLQTELEGARSEIKSAEDFQKQLAITLGSENDTAKILGEIVKLREIEDQFRKVQKDKESVEEQLRKTEEALDKIEDMYHPTLEENTKLKTANEELVRDRKQLVSEIAELLKQNRMKFYKLFWKIYLGEVSK